MDIGNWIALAVIVAVSLGAIGYIVYAKRKGKTCIGCPDGCGNANGFAGCAGCKKCDQPHNDVDPSSMK